MFGLADRENKKKGKLSVGNVLVLLHLHRCDRQEATDQSKTKKLVDKPKQQLQWDL